MLNNSTKLLVYSLTYIDCLDADADMVGVDTRPFLPPCVVFSITAFETAFGETAIINRDVTR